MSHTTVTEDLEWIKDKENQGSNPAILSAPQVLDLTKHARKRGECSLSLQIPALKVAELAEGSWSFLLLAVENSHPVLASGSHLESSTNRISIYRWGSSESQS